MPDPSPFPPPTDPDSRRLGPREVKPGEAVRPEPKREPITSRFLQHFLFVEDPFSLSPDPHYLYLSESHGEALAALDLGITERRGLIVLVGEVGTGKTTLAHHVANTLGSEVRVALVSNTTLSFEEMLDIILRELGRPQPDGAGKGRMIEALRELATRANQHGGTVAILIDEAQNLEIDVLEEFRQLLNIETDTEKLIQIVLIGQPELHEKLAEKRVRHVADRIAVRCVLDPLSPVEAREYIAHRLERAGGTPQVFSKAALKAIVRESQGLPRSINVLCHNALLFAFGKGDETVRKEEAQQAIRERRGPTPKRARAGRGRGLGWLAAAIALVLLGATGMWLLDRGLDARSESATRAASAGTETSPSSGPAGEETVSTLPDSSAVAAEAAEAVADTLARSEQSSVGDRALAEDASATTEVGQEAGDASTVPDATIVDESDDALIVQVERGLNLHDLMITVYGQYRPDLIDRILEDNPEIEDPDLLFPGQVIRLPLAGDE